MSSAEANNTEAVVEGVKSGLGWISALRIVAQLVSWVATFLTIRFLTPEDYGLNAFAEVIYSILLVVAPLGVDRSLVQAKEVTRLAVRSVFGALLLVNLVLLLLTLISAPLIASYYDNDRLLELAAAIGFCFIFLPFSMVSRALLARDMKFKEIAICDLIVSLSSATIMLGLAYAGYGAWALVLSTVAAAAITAATFSYFAKFNYLPLFDLSKVKSVLAFGGSISVQRFLILFTSKAYILIGGYYLGAETVGYFVIAFNLALMPLSKLMPIVNQVAFPALAKLGGDNQVIRHYYKQGLGLVIFIIAPLMLGLGAVSENFATIVLGDNWLELWPVLMVLCAVMPLHVCFDFFVLVIQSKGKNRAALYASVVMFVVAIVGVFAFGRQGVMVLAMVKALELVAAFVVLFFGVNKLLSLGAVSHVVVILRNLLPSVGMFMFVVFVGQSIQPLAYSDYLQMIIQVGAGGFSFLILAVVFSKETVKKMISLVIGRGK